MSTRVLNEHLLTIAEVAARLRLTEKTVRRLVDNGELSALRVGHGRGVLRVDPTELYQWLYAVPPKEQR